MKIRHVPLALLTLATLSIFHPKTARPQGDPPALLDLGGSYAGKSVGFTTVCTNAGGCGSPSPVLVEKNFAAVTQADFDAAGNFCGTATATSAPVTGSAAPIDVAVRTIAGGLASFDPRRLEGEVSFKIYQGGSCHRTTFDSAGATLTTTGTARVLVSDGGIRIDGVVETYIGAADQFGSVLNNVTLIKQRADEDRDRNDDRSGRDFSLAELRGKYTAKSSGVETVCADLNGCQAVSPVLVPLNFSADAQGDVDADGNYCATAVTTSAPEAGEASSAFVATKVTLGKVTSFDPENGQADITFVEYVGGHCRGAGFDSHGATELANGTAHLVISDSGRRIDALATSYVGGAGIIGGVVNTTTLFRRVDGDSQEGRREP